MKMKVFNLFLVFTAGFGFLSVLAMHSVAFSPLAGMTLMFAMLTAVAPRK